MQRFDLSFRTPAPRRCPVRVGAGAVAELVDWLIDEPPGRPVVLISDDRVAPLHAEPLVRSLTGRGVAAPLLTFPAGERHKTRQTKERLEDGLVDLGVGRDGAILAVGGGVTGDLAGFVASTWQRGIPVVQVPTSLLAMVDAALGGKTAVNLPSGKNLVGTFHQPAAIFADVATLGTLPDRELIEGLAEVVKSAVVADASLFRDLEASVDALSRRDARVVERVVATCLRIKARVVAADEREHVRRAILNFGHTVGHALEAVSGFAVSHGHAVAIGMCVEGELARDHTGFGEASLRRLEALLERVGLPTRVPAEVEPGAILPALVRDKKTRRGRPRYALPRRIGSMLPGGAVTVEVRESEVARALERRLAAN